MGRPLLLAAAGCLSLAAASLLLVPAAPGYDAWAWLVWGREVGRLELDTVAGPAWKPLPVAVTTALAPAGGAAPVLWLAVARAGAVAAILLAFVAARRLAAGSLLAGAVAAAGVLLTGGFVRHAAVGDSEPLLVALLLGAFLLALDDRHRTALAVAGTAALLRPEVWPLLALYGLWRLREDRWVVLGLAVAVPVAWFGPELASSGELLRSADRARIPNPGQPATADVPALETLTAALSVVVLPAALLALAARRAAAIPALAGAAWIVLVALMSQAGFSGEPRYLLPGAALVAVSAGPGVRSCIRTLRSTRQRLGAPGGFLGKTVCRSARPEPVVVGVVVVLAAPQALALRDLPARLDHQRALASDLRRAIDDAGGRERLLACGRPAVGRFRGTLLAWQLDVPKRAVRADGRPGGATFTSRLTARAAASPPAGRSARTLATTRTWRVTCAT